MVISESTLINKERKRREREREREREEKRNQIEAGYDIYLFRI